MWQRLRRWRWRRKMRHTPLARCSLCAVCGGPIYPGQWVAVSVDGGHIHAGFHDTLTRDGVFCETAAVASAFWDGDRLRPIWRLDAEGKP